MLRRLLGLILFLSLCQMTRAQAETPAAPRAVWLEVDIGLIGAASADTLKSALSHAQKQNAAGLIIVLDTPGGALEATRTMVKDILAAPIPVVVWVGPSGAHAGSAGAFITLAATVAAMAPGTQIGAAHPVSGTGEDLELGSDMRRKVENDALAFMDSIAVLRSRNKEVAASFVATSLSLTAEESLEKGVIDLIARDQTELMQKLDGRQVKLGEGTTIKLQTSGVERVVYAKTLRQQLLEMLSNPNLFYLLFIAGLLGIGFELTHPGTLVPGVLGAISLILALISSSVLPINAGAMLLIIASVAFMVAEIFIPSFGVLGIGGFIGFVVGSMLLIDADNELGLALSWWSIIPAALVMAGFSAFVSFLVLRNQRARVRSGSEGLIGKSAEAMEDFRNASGQVRLEGEIWNAKESTGRLVTRGAQLRIDSIQGLTLHVTLISP